MVMIRRVAVCCLALASAAAAEEVFTNAVRQLPPVIVTATRIPTPPEDVGSAVTVISRDQIEESQARSVTELLRDVPGVSVVQSGRPGGQTSVFLRGVNSNQTLFMIDGARINNPLNGLVTLANLTPDQIERIEIVRGPQSTLYGADAIGGVINIITRKGTGKPTGSISLEGGSHNLFRQSADVSGAYSNLDYAVSLSHLDTDNVFRNDDFENLTVSSSVGYRVLDNLKLDATVRYTKAETGVPGAIIGGVPSSLTERLLDETLFVRVGMDFTPFEFWRQSLFVAETHEELLDRGDPAVRSDSLTDVVQVGWQNTFPLADWNTLIAGLDWYYNRGHFAGFGSVFDANVDNTAAFVQDQVTLWKRLSLTGGGRFDHHSQFGDKFTYRFAGALRVTDTTRLKASAGTGFKAPTLNDLFFPGFSNPALKPEESFGWDAGFEQDICGGRATLGARYFENSIDNLIAFPPPTFLPANVERARTQGLELTLLARPLTNLTLWANYTWLIAAKNLSTGADLLRRPEHTGSVGASYRFLKRFALHTDATLVGPRDDLDPVTFATVRNASYIKWDAALTVDITKHLQLFGRVENLLDDQFEEAKGFPALGRVFYAGGRARF
jgi:vitamin B12 transporter